MPSLEEDINDTLDRFAEALKPASFMASVIAVELKTAFARIFAKLEENAAHAHSVPVPPLEPSVSASVEPASVTDEPVQEPPVA